MIPVVEKTNITDHMGGEKTVMSVRAEDWKKLSGLLINLYSDTILAVIREYSTNALDTQIEAGVTEPIRVTTPNAFNNLFVIEDSGTGMSKDDLQKTYAMFGASTKDQSNDYNGSMGLGSKSALTYTDSFTVISTKDGITTTAIVGRDEEGNGIMEVLSEVDSGDPSGTTIQIPAKSGDEFEFERKADEFYSYWPEGTVILNGVPVKPFDPASIGYEELVDDLWVKRSEISSTLTIVMGNVAYRHHFERPYDKMASDLKIFFYAPNGVVQFSPSRESLLMNKPTTEYVESLIDSAVDLFISKATDAISGAVSIVDALNEQNKYRGIFVDGALEWNGKPLLQKFAYHGRSFSPMYNDNATSKETHIRSLSAYDQGAVILSGINVINKNHKDAIRAYNDSLPDGEKIRNIYYGGMNDHHMLEHARVVEWESIKPFYSTIKSDAKSKTYDMFYYDKTDKKVKFGVSTLPVGKKWKYLYVSPKNIKGGWSYSFPDMSWLSEMGDVVVVVLAANRFEKFCKDYPDNAHELYSFVRSWATKVVDSVTDDEKSVARLSNQPGETRMFSAFVGKTEDTYIDKVAENLLSWQEKISLMNKVFSSLRISGIELPESENMGNYFERKYPLVYLASNRGYNTYFNEEHAIKYINMINAEEEEND